MPLALLLLPTILAAAPQPACVPSHPVAEGVPAGDSVIIAGRRVARTAHAVRRAHLGDRLRIDGPQLHAGERIVFLVDEVERGTAVYDGCRLVAESSAPAAVLPSAGIETLEVRPAAADGYKRVVIRTAGTARRPR
jgi:hypothetical protein